MRDVLRILIPLLVWLAAFSGIYGLHGLLCGHRIEGAVFGLDLTRVLMVSAYAVAILMQVLLLAGLYSARFASPSGFVRFVSRGTGWVGLIATVWSLLPVLTTTYCL